jgi:hypothetical protein
LLLAASALLEWLCLGSPQRAGLRVTPFGTNESVSRVLKLSLQGLVHPGA